MLQHELSILTMCVCVCVCVCGTTCGEVLDRLRNWQLFPKYSAVCASCGAVWHVQVTTAHFERSLSFSLLLLLVFHMVGTDVYCRPTAPPSPSQKTHRRKGKGRNVLQPLTSYLTFRVGVCSRLCDITCLTAMHTIGLAGSLSEINMKSGPTPHVLAPYIVCSCSQTARHLVAKDGNLDFIVMFEDVACIPEHNKRYVSCNDPRAVQLTSCPQAVR